MTDQISHDALTESVGLLRQRCFSQWSKMDPIEWAENVYRLPTLGRFSFDYAPYSRAMFLSIFDPATIETCFQLYSRGLKSTVILLAIGYTIDQAPRRILSLWPTNAQAEKFSKDILTGELFDTTEPLAFLGSANKKRDGGNTLLHKTFPGGLIDLFGANAPGDMRRAKGNLLYADEIDAIDETQTDEGDQLAIFAKRGDEYPDCIRVFASYPSVKDKSRIAARMAKTDWNEWYSTCVVCGGEPFVMHRNLVRWDKGKPEGAAMECPRCRAMLTDGQRHTMAHKQGFDCWKPRNEFRGRRGFHANAMLWPHPVDPAKYRGGFLQLMAEAVEAAQSAANPTRAIRVVVNTVDAEPFHDETASELPPEANALIARREDYGDLKSVTVPHGAVVITVGVDVHKNRLEVFWQATGRDEETWALMHNVLMGEVQDKALWIELEKELQRTFTHEIGCKVGLDFALIDAGKWPEWVHFFLQHLVKTGSSIRGKVRACRGSSNFPHPLIDARFSSIAKNLKGHWVGTDEAKDYIYSRLKMERSEDGTFPKGFYHYHLGFEPVFFEQLTSEKVSIIFKGGEELRKFKNESHARNEALDISVYALAARRLRRWNYDAIERELIARAMPVEPQEEKPARRFAQPARRIGTMGGWRV